MKQYHSLKSSILYSLFGLGAPLIAGLISIPLLLNFLDGPRYAFVSLTWIIIGYTSVLDLGLGRSLTKQVPAILIKSGQRGVQRIVIKTVRMMSVISAVGVCLLWVFNEHLVKVFGNISGALLSEARFSLFLIGLAVPAIVLSSGYRGALEGLGRFRMTGLIRAASGSLMFLFPVLVALFDKNLASLTASLVLTRYLTLLVLWIAYGAAVRGLSESTTTTTELKTVSSSGLLREAGWMTVSNIISPLLVYMDRFFVSRILGLAIVPFYSAPYDVVSRLTIIPEAVFAVLFPRMSGAHVMGIGELEKTHSASLRGIGVLMFVGALVLVTVAPVFLGTLLGGQFAQRSTGVMSILLIGVFINTCARPPYNVLQATGHSKTTGILHLLELAPYIVLLMTFTEKFGIEGAAAAWTLRTSVDAVALTLACSRVLNGGAKTINILGTIALASGALATIATIDYIPMRLAAGIALLLAAAVICYCRLVTADEREEIIFRARSMTAALPWNMT
jgi:O-antigen/teichoic acid export membrane protein